MILAAAEDAVQRLVPVRITDLGSNTKRANSPFDSACGDDCNAVLPGGYPEYLVTKRKAFEVTTPPTPPPAHADNAR